MDDEDIWHYTGGRVENERITKVVIQDGVRKIYNYAFTKCPNIRSITIPNSVTSIGSDAFDGLEKLETLVIPDSVKAIGESAFSGCSSLKTIVIPEGVAEINDYTFYFCHSLQSITFPKSLTKIGSYAFRACRALEQVEIPKGVKVIGPNAFTDCEALEQFEIPNGVEVINVRAFAGCKSLKCITLPKSLTKIGWDVFVGCTVLEEVDIVNGITIIPLGAFQGCTSLHTVTLPPTIDEFGEDAFQGCNDLENFVIHNGLPALKYRFNPFHVGFGFNSWKIVKQILENASNLTRMTIKNNFVGVGCAIDTIKDDDILKVLELVSAGPTLREVDLSTRNCLTAGVFETLALQDIPGHLRLLKIEDQSPKWREASSSPEHLLQVLERNPKLVIKTDKFWHDSEDRKVRHQLDMNEYGCRGFTLRDSRWPEFIETLAVLEKEQELRTGPPNILYHLFCRQLNVLINYPQDNSSRDKSGGATSVKRPRRE